MSADRASAAAGAARLLAALNNARRQHDALVRVRRRVIPGGGASAAWVTSPRFAVEEADLVEAFGSRFGRLQDMIVDKLLPGLLVLAGEKTGTAIDNLNRCERLGWVGSAATWTAMRGLRNKLVHEYVEDAAEFAAALNQAAALVADMTATLDRIEAFARSHPGPASEIR